MGIGNVIDLVSEDKKIVAEIKNKYNTVSGGNLSGVYNALDALESLFDVLPDVISECTDGKYRVKDIEKLKYFFKLAFG